MKLHDDSTLSQDQYSVVRKEAERLLRTANAVGRFPTPVDDLVAAAGLVVATEEIFDESFIQSLRRKAGTALKRALSKIIGLFDAKDRIIYIDRTIHKNKIPFLSIHETGHGVLPWQKNLYSVIEDCDQTLSPEISDLFDREANVFASEVLFQLDGFSAEAAQHKTSIKTPLALSKKYGASVYSSIRRYVSHHHHACAVLILDSPEILPDIGFRANLRRSVESPSFSHVFGTIQWPDFFVATDGLARFIPVGRKRMSSPGIIVLRDRNGDRWECVAEGFTQTYQVFILIHSTKSLASFPTYS